MIRVFLTDDHVMFRDGLIRLLSDEPSIEVVGTAETLQQCTERLLEQAVDVLVLDLNLPDGSGLDMVKRFAASAPGLRVLVLTALPEDHVAVRCLQAGAAGFVNKRQAGAVLVEAIQRVASGQRFIGPQLAEVLLTVVESGADVKPHERLSPREFQVMRELVDGGTVSEIALRMNLSVKTVSTYKTRIQEKLGLRGTADIVLYAVNEKLFYEPPGDAANEAIAGLASRSPGATHASRSGSTRGAS